MMLLMLAMVVFGFAATSIGGEPKEPKPQTPRKLALLSILHFVFCIFAAWLAWFSYSDVPTNWFGTVIWSLMSVANLKEAAQHLRAALAARRQVGPT